jgi:hypothetical protein
MFGHEEYTRVRVSLLCRHSFYLSLSLSLSFKNTQKGEKTEYEATFEIERRTERTISFFHQ